jgi:hypothetical protein
MNIVDECDICLRQNENDCHNAITTVCLKGYMSRYDCLNNAKHAMIRLCLHMDMDAIFSWNATLLIWPIIILFITIIIYGLSIRFLRYAIDDFKKMTYEAQMKSTFNFVEIIITTGLVIYILLKYSLIVSFSRDFWYNTKDLSLFIKNYIDAAVPAGLFMSFLYMAEIVGIPQIRFPLLLHHFIGILLCFVSLLCTLYAKDYYLIFSISKCNFMIIMFAISEQCVFVFMIVYRSSMNITKKLRILKWMHYGNASTRVLTIMGSIIAFSYFLNDMIYIKNIDGVIVFLFIYTLSSFFVILWAQYTTFIATKKMLIKLAKKEKRQSAFDIQPTILNKNVEMLRQMSDKENIHHTGVTSPVNKNIKMLREVSDKGSFYTDEEKSKEMVRELSSSSELSFYTRNETHDVESGRSTPFND